MQQFYYHFHMQNEKKYIVEIVVLIHKYLLSNHISNQIIVKNISKELVVVHMKVKFTTHSYENLLELAV